MPKKSKRARREEEDQEDQEDQEEQEEQEQPHLEDEAEENSADEEIDEDEGQEDQNGGNKLTPEQKEENRKARRKLLAKKRGYRRQASRAGYGYKAASGMSASRDVIANIVSVPETIRACKWKPEQAKCPAFATLSEFKERVALSQEPLPPGPAAVYRANLEVLLRRVIDEATLRSNEMGKPRITPALLHSVIRPLGSVLRFSYMQPRGLVRHAQNVVIRNSRKGNVNALNFTEQDDAECKVERDNLPKQVEYKEKIEANIEKRRAERSNKKNAKKAKTSAAAAQA